MNRNHPSPFATLETSDGFLGPLWRGTMQSLLDRTREDGFCQTSFGEENGVKCYGVCHYSRDAAEAAGVLADQGCPEPAARILDFTLSHIPEGQYFIVHAYRPDGTPLHNKIQIDTPAHPARALARLLETGADDPALPRCFDRLDRVFDDTWRHHFHAAFRLLDSGNYNEQLGGGTEPLLDLFTNGAMYGGCLAMAEAARLLNRPAIVTERYLERAALLDRGIDHWLYDPAADGRLVLLSFHFLLHFQHILLHLLGLLDHVPVHPAAHTAAISAFCHRSFSLRCCIVLLLLL